MKIAIVQKEPVVNDLKATTELTCQMIREAGNAGAHLIVFGETWLCGYPVYLDYAQNINEWNGSGLKKVYSDLLNNSPALSDKSISDIREAALTNGIAVYLGMHEKSASGKSLFNSIIAISPQGEIVQHHRKMVPTFTEKLLHKPAESFDLNVFEIQEIKIGGLICWEHWMPLARQFYHDSGEQIHVAFWPNVHEMHQVASRHYAFEGRCFVIAVGQLFSSQQIPKPLKIMPSYNDRDLLLRGGSCVIGPNGQFLLEPVWDQDTILYVDLPSIDQIQMEALTLDTAGHYARPDLFDFKIRNK